MNKGARYTVGPYQLSLDITNKCNLRCLHCYNSSGANNVMNEELSDDEVKDFIISLIPMKLLNLCFCGGETLLRRELIYDCARILSNSGIRTALVSNGILASEDVIHNLYFAGIKSIQFSMDGCCAKTHDRLRNQQGVYEKVTKALDIVRKYDWELSVSFAPTSFNVEELEDLHTYLESLSYKNKMELRLQPLMPLGRGNKNMEEICPTEEQYRRLVNTVNKINRNGPKVKAVWGDPIDHLIRFPYLEDLPMYYTSVRSNGDIVISPYLPLVIGNIRKHTFKQYWIGGLQSIWKKKIPQYMASFVKCIDDMGTLNEKFPETFMNDIYIDMLEEDLNDMNVLYNKMAE
ncbi:MAG: radical SAM protein [Lachnospiraceae bacterium]|nr:radical SAM protein [Lachnospiraceae bacterium]